MSDPETAAVEYLVGVRLREVAKAEDSLAAEDLELHVGDLVMVSTEGGQTVGEVRRPRRPLPDFKRDRPFQRVQRPATEAEGHEWRERREREKRAIVPCQHKARDHRLAIKVVDVEFTPGARRTTVYFNAEERVDFRELVRDLAREFRARVEMRQIGARDTTHYLDGIGPRGRQRCCTPHLRKLGPLSVKMAQGQGNPLTDKRLLGNCRRVECCLRY